MKLFQRDANANVIEIGIVTLEGNKLKFSDFKDESLRKWLQRGIEFGGELLTGRSLYDKLPVILRGDRLWAAV